MTGGAMPGAAGRAVLVTGAGGFIGRHLVARLAADGWQVRAATRDPAAIPSAPGVTPVQIGDLASRVDWQPLLAGVSHVVHLAGIAHATHAIPEATYMAVNSDATRDLATAARQAGVARLVLVSSVRAQCGPCAAGVLDERIVAAPEDAYGRSKLAAEHQVADALAGAGCDWCVLRPVVVYGPGVKANMHALRQLARTRLPLPLAGLTGRRSLLGLDTLADAIAHALTASATSRATYLVAEPGALTVAQIVAALRAGSDRAPAIFALPHAPMRLVAGMLGKGAAWSRLAGDLVVSTATFEASGWRPRQTASEGLARWTARG